jgi:hypothetical protein
MNTLTIKISPGLDSALVSASATQQVSKSEIVRRAIQAYLDRPATSSAAPSALALAGDLVGCFAGGPTDLASNPKHMERFGLPLVGS